MKVAIIMKPRYRILDRFLAAILGLVCVTSSAMATTEMNTEDSTSSNTVKISDLNLPPELEEMDKQFQSMSNEELNDYISNIVNSPQTRGVTTSTMQLAWLAAPQVAINKGNPCSGTLVKYSVNGVTYRETNGIFKSKIKASGPYKKWAQKPTQQYDLVTFTSAYPDLYYSLHTASFKMGAMSAQSGMINVYDKYDFDITFMGSLFATLVNDWAALCMYTGVLNEIYVHIDFNA